MSRELKQQILELAKEKGALLFGEFTLSAGGTSNYYFDSRLLTLTPQGSNLVAKAMLPSILESKAEMIGGPSLAADPIVSSIVTISLIEGFPISGFLVRGEPKAHGAQRLIEGPLKPGASVAILEDTCTSGASIFHAIRAAEAEGCRVVKVISILDRVEGGSAALKGQGYKYESLLRADSIGGVEIT